MKLLEHAIPPPHDKKPGCRFPQGATAFTKFSLRCFTGDDNYDDFCTHFAFLSRKSWFCAVSWRKWHICALNGLLILMKENPSNLGHCSLTCCLRFHFWSLGFPLQWASVKVTRCSGWVVVGCCADELLPLALAGWGSCTEYVFFCIHV